MYKKIEIINASDANLLKEQLEQMVNTGWQIKGVVGYNRNDASSEPFVILEREYDTNPDISENLYYNEDATIEQYSKPEPLKKEISISMGN
jgi:hypothetical protein